REWGARVVAFIMGFGERLFPRAVLQTAFGEKYPRPMRAQPPIEDISAIVNRFQAWAGAQPQPRTRDGVRELTYDEAIRSRQRRKIPLEPLSEAEQPLSATPPKTKLRTQSSNGKQRIAAPRRPKHDRSAISSTGDQVVAPEPMMFRDVLAEKVSILPAVSSQNLITVEPRRTALSLRVSLSEHALLKRRAAEANLPVSTYLRNCALEVENLRMQLARTLEEQRAKHMPSYVQTSAFASCMQIVRRLFFRKTTTLAVRA